MHLSARLRGRGPSRGLARAGFRYRLVLLPCLGLTAWAATLATAGAADDASVGQPNRLTLVRLSTRPEAGGWVVDYRLRNETPAGLIVSPSEIEVKSDGWVSNSRLPGHASPRRASVALKGGGKAVAVAEVTAAADESARCAERLALEVWSDEQAPDVPSRPVDVLAPISLGPGGTGLLRLRFSHQHAVLGAYDPLLGARTVAVRIGEETFHDVLPLDHEAQAAHPKAGWPEPPEDRRDATRFVSGPDSLHLEAHVPGRQYYRFPDRPVRHGARMRLSFWYLVAHGTSGECRFRLAQYQSAARADRVLPAGGLDRSLPVVGRWTKVDAVVRIEAQATDVSLDFRISSDANLGEMWIDDVVFEPLDVETLAQGP